MRLRSCPGGVKVSTLPGKPEVSGSIPDSGIRFLFIIVVFTSYYWTKFLGQDFASFCKIQDSS